MYRGMREMIVECWCVNLRKVWSHAVLVCIVHVVCTTVQNTQIYCEFLFPSFYASFTDDPRGRRVTE